MYISDLNDVPGYMPITKSTPIWKKEMIEKKNQEKIEEYIVSQESEEKKEYCKFPKYSDTQKKLL